MRKVVIGNLGQYLGWVNVDGPVHTIAIAWAFTADGKPINIDFYKVSDDKRHIKKAERDLVDTEFVRVGSEMRLCYPLFKEADYG